MNTIISRCAIAASLILGLQAAADSITTTLRLHSKVSMQQLAQNVQDPASDHFGRYYTPEEIRTLAGPSGEEYAALVEGLKLQGLHVVGESPTRLWIQVRGETAAYETLFATQVRTFANGDRRQLLAARVPFYLSIVQGVTGLDNTGRRHPKYQIAGQQIVPGGINNATIKSVYGFDPIYSDGINGQGQHIAIATYDSFVLDNVRNYFQLVALSPVPQVDQIAFNGPAKYNEQSAGETELDVELSGMIAPGSSIHVFTSATNDDVGELQMYTAILDDNRAKVVNYSWGMCETDLTPQHKAEMEAVFARAAAQGVNVMVASGDTGSDGCRNGTVKADWPAANPAVVAVGGTHLLTSGGTANETAWRGSGGGISDIWELPTYQSAIGAPFLRRSFPDVAFNADPFTGQPIWSGAPGAGQWMIVGGTSAAAPQWAGFLALANHARANAGKPAVGFLNPILYAMDANTRAATMRDVTAGNNGAYKAGTGWDATTGWGSMRASALLNYLKTL